VVIMPQEKHRFRERVDFITSPGFGDGPGWRERVGLRGGGPTAVVTTLGVFRFDPATCQMYLASYHPGQSVESVRAATGFDLAVAPDVAPTPTPSGQELAIVRACDPAGFWTR
jgi:glutaconate CoA-transferase, subunit B